ncbi:MAG TPA: ABC transporter permease subunit [Gemmataceae bacterium]|jgi:iron(III) transport system permease protein|nr:ABC transporter permease subunit [Gemmataceae bacterium]
MTWWRAVAVLMLLLVVGLPVGLPFAGVLRDSHGWQAWSEYERILSLAKTTLQLVLATLALVLPLGITGAVLLYRTDLPFRGGLRLLTLLVLFIPLPLFTSAWQAALGTGGLLPVAVWTNPAPGDPDVSATGVIAKPWGHGLGTAVWVHAMAGLPWAILLIGQGLLWVERELEEDALLAAGPWRVLWQVTLPRSRAAIFAAGLWVALMIVTEITVTDMMQVRTFAEEVYTQFVTGDRQALARAVAVALPLVVLVAALVVWSSLRWQHSLPPLETLTAPPRLIPLGPVRWLCLALILLFVGVLLAIPLSSLIWKVGLAGSPESWSAHTAGVYLTQTLRDRGRVIVESLLLAMAAGVITAGLGLILCWLAMGARWFHACVLGLMAVVWALPGPILGLGMKDAIARILDVIPFRPLGIALYYGPSPVPVAWVDLVRFFPCAVAMLWPVVRLMPQELRDAARVDGARPPQELWHVLFPLAVPAFARAAFAVMVLSLGEIAAGKLAATPGSLTFAMEVFDRMHYGVSNDLAALCLILLAGVLLGGCLFAIAGWWWRRSSIFW